jgi:hypothetical protein
MKFEEEKEEKKQKNACVILSFSCSSHSLIYTKTRDAGLLIL